MSSMPSDTGFTFLPQGALIQEFKISGHNIVLGFPERNMYISHNTPYFGEVSTQSHRQGAERAEMPLDHWAYYEQSQRRYYPGPKW